MKKSVILLLLLTACAGHITKPGATQQEMQADEAACNYEVLKSTGSANNNDPIGVGMMHAQIFNACMSQKGYVSVRN